MHRGSHAPRGRSAPRASAQTACAATPCATASARRATGRLPERALPSPGYRTEPVRDAQGRARVRRRARGPTGCRARCRRGQRVRAAATGCAHRARRVRRVGRTAVHARSRARRAPWRPIVPWGSTARGVAAMEPWGASRGRADRRAWTSRASPVPTWGRTSTAPAGARRVVPRRTVRRTRRRGVPSVSVGARAMQTARMRPLGSRK